VPSRKQIEFWSLTWFDGKKDGRSGAPRRDYLTGMYSEGYRSGAQHRLLAGPPKPLIDPLERKDPLPDENRANKSVTLGSPGAGAG